MENLCSLDHNHLRLFHIHLPQFLSYVDMYEFSSIDKGLSEAEMSYLLLCVIISFSLEASSQFTC